MSSKVAIANSDAIPSPNSLEYDSYRNYLDDLSAAEVALDEALRWGVQADAATNLPRVISTQVIPSIDGNLPANSYALFSGPSFDNNLLRSWYVGPITIDASGDFILNTVKQKWSPSPRDNLRGVRNGYVYDVGNPNVKREVELQLYRNTASGKIEYFAKSIAGIPLEDVQLYNICQRYGLRFDDLPSNVSDFIQNYPVEQFDDFIAALDDVDANILDGVTELFSDIAGHPDDAYRAVFLSGDGVRAWEVLHSAGKTIAKTNIKCLQLFIRIDVPDLYALKLNLVNNLNDSKLIEFSSDFGETVTETLQRINDDVSILNYWKLHKQELLTPYVTNTGDIPSVSEVADFFQSSPEIIGLINAVDDSPLPSNNQFVMAGCQHSSLPSTYQIKYNFTSAGTDYEAFINSCHPLSMVRCGLSRLSAKFG